MVSTKRGRWSLAFVVAAAVAIVSSHPAAGQSIVGPATASIDQEVRLVVEGLDTPSLDKAADWAKKVHLHVSAPDDAKWVADPELTLALGSGGLRLRIYFSADKPGVYVIVLLDNNGVSRPAFHRLIVGGQPVPPTPGPTPGPIPDPRPPEPVPPTPALSTFSVMIVEETADRSSLPRSQAAAMASLGVRGYFTQKNAVWRMWDDDYTDQQVAGESQEIQQLYKRAVSESKGKRPWIVLGNKTGSESVELPADEAGLMELLKKWGG